MLKQAKIISLKPIYTYIVKIAKKTDLHAALSDKREYAEICKNLAQQIDPCQGFYLWGKYNKKRLWTNIYLGKAGYGKTAYLRSRILEELIDERMCFWRKCYSEDELMDAGQRLHHDMWSKYAKGAKRAFLKAGSTHIVWVPTEHLNNKDILRVEADLIEAMNPVANIVRPAPPAMLQADTRNIFEQLRICIHEARNSKFEIKLAD
jgi:hypothetical protein